MSLFPADREYQHYFKTPNKISLNKLIFDHRDELILHRRHFHQNPELSYKEFETAAYITSYLEKLSPKLIIKTNIAKTGVTALLIGGGNKNGKCILLRADMDALPVQEEGNDFEYKSKNKDISHCCGHDLHISILLVTAKILCQYQPYLNGSVKFCFQPAEEGGAGAKYMIKENVLINPAVDQVYGLHVSSIAPLGTVLINKTPKVLMAGCCNCFIDVIGVGGHGAMPHASKDAINAGTCLVQQLHTIISRNISPSEMGVLTIGTFNGGYKNNVIADKVNMSGTIRWYKNEIGDIIKQRIRSICKGIEESFEVKVNIKFGQEEYPALINSEIGYKNVCNAARKIVGNDGLMDDVDTIPASEDFSYFLQEKDGAYFFVGGKLEDGKDKMYMHHMNNFKIDERCMVIGCQTFVQLVLDLLATNNNRAKL